MGQAKQRGTFEQRRLEAQQAEALRLEARRVQIEVAKEAERQRRQVQSPTVAGGLPRPSRHSAFGRGASLSRSIAMGAVMVALTKGKP